MNRDNVCHFSVGTVKTDVSFSFGELNEKDINKDRSIVYHYFGMNICEAAH